MDKEIIIERTNAAFMTIYTGDEGIKEHIYQEFRYQKPNFVKSNFSKFDGVVRLFNKKTGSFPYGLLPNLLKFLKTHKYTYELDDRFKIDIMDVTKEEITEWALSLDLHSKGKPITPYDYQLDTLYTLIRFNRLTGLLATSAGKSAIFYMASRFYDQIGYDEGKTLIIVPSIGLVTQLFNDFMDYSSKNKWDVPNNVHCIQAGAAKHTNKNIIISTWQSLQTQPADYFRQFARVFVDECHLASGKEITNIMNSSINAYTRCGLTGTLNGTDWHEMAISSLFGMLRTMVTMKELQDAGRAADSLVVFINIQYPEKDREYVFGCDYKEEIEFLLAHPFRNKVIKSIAKTVKGNSLFLYGRRETHLDILHAEITAENPDVHVHYIAGGVDGEEREEIKRILDSAGPNEKHIINATSRTTATGTSINNLHNIGVFHPNKAVIGTLQGLGRGARLHESKVGTVFRVYHIVDDLTYMGKRNTTLEHGFKCYGYYASEQHDIQVKNIKVPSDYDKAK